MTLTPVLSFFSILHTGRTARPIFTLYGSNDMFPRKEVPFGGRTIGDVILGKYAPNPSPPKVGMNMQIQAKTWKCRNCTISETVNPIKPKFQDIAATINYTSWVVYHYPTTDPTWLTAAILKIANRYDIITRPRMVRFGWNLACQRRITCR